MKLIFLGTSAGKITPERNVTSIALDLHQERRGLWLFDCGEGTQHQMMRAKLNLSRIEKIFITHLHGDHTFGLPVLLSTRSLQQNQSSITLFGPVGIKQFIDTTLNLTGSFLTYPLNIIEIDQPMRLVDEPDFRVVCQELVHRVPSYGFRITKKSHATKLDLDKLAADKINVGKMYNQFKFDQLITYPDGGKIECKKYWLTQTDEKVLTILGDTSPCDNAIVLAKNANLLVHEATHADNLQDKANERGHSTTIQAALIAKKSAAKQLIITHISPRYPLKDNDKLVNECKKYFCSYFYCNRFLPS